MTIHEIYQAPYFPCNPNPHTILKILENYFLGFKQFNILDVIVELISFLLILSILEGILYILFSQRPFMYIKVISYKIKAYQIARSLPLLIRNTKCWNPFQSVNIGRASKSTGAWERRSQKEIRTAEKKNRRILGNKIPQKKKRVDYSPPPEKKNEKSIPLIHFFRSHIFFSQTHVFTLVKTGAKTLFLPLSQKYSPCEFPLLKLYNFHILYPF